MRITLKDLKNSRIPQQINVAPNSARFVSIANEAVEKLISRGHWLGTAGRYLLTVTNGITTLPPSLASIEGIAINTIPTPIRSAYWEFVSSGDGVRGTANRNNECIRIPGLFPTAVDVTPGSRIKVVCDSASDVAKLVVICGVDTNGNVVRTLQSGIVSPGKAVALSQGGTLDATLWNQITGIIAPSDMSQGWWLYTEAGTLLSQYAHWETNPGYTRYHIPSADGTQTIEAVGRAAYVPMKQDNDFCLISNIPAMKYAMASCLSSERNDLASDMAQMKLATNELDFQLSHHSEAETPALQIVGPNIGEINPVESLI